MARLFRQEMVGSKIDLLVRQRDNILEQRNYLQTLLDGANELLQLATSWLSNYDGANDVTFKDINKMIDDKLMLLSDTDISVDCEKRFISAGSSSTDQPLPTVSASTHLPMPTRHDQVSDELKAITNQVKVMQDAMEFLSKSTENISEKQLTMEKFTESLSAQCSKIEQEQERIRKIETQLKNIDEKQKKTTVQQDKKMKSFENKITAVTDAQSVLEEKWQAQRKEQKKKNEKQSQTFTQDLNGVLENVQELSTRICELESKYKMVCQILADKLAPLEKLRDIFNKNLDKREKHLEKLDNVCDQMTSILPKIAQLETERPGPTIGFSVRYYRLLYVNTTTALYNFTDIFCNNGNHFNPATGEFTAPLEGLYATSISIQNFAELEFYLTIKKQPCMSCIHPNQCDECTVAELLKSSEERSCCTFVVVNMKAGEKLSVIFKKETDVSHYPLNVMFVCFRIG